MSLVDRYGNPIKSRQVYAPATVLYKRETRDRDDYSPIGTVLSPQEEVDWKLQSFTEDQLSRLEFRELINTLIDTCPDLNAALSAMQMNVNTSFEISILEEDQAAQRIIDNSLDTMTLDRKESLSTKLDKLVASGYLKGAFHFENVFSDSNAFMNIAIADPLRVRFEEYNDTQLGQTYRMGQEIDGIFKPFESKFVHYHPLNPVENKPFGRGMITAAIFPMIFLLGLIKSGRQVIETQAWPYQVATVNPQTYRELGLDPEEIGDRVDLVMEQVRQEFLGSKKGTQFVFDASVEIDQLGMMGRGNLDAIEMIESILKRWIILALKQVPILFGISEGAALSSNAEQQLEYYSIFIGSFQDKLEEVMTICFTQILREAGNPSTPVFKLKRINSLVERMRLERMKIKADSIKIMIDSGIISPSEGRTIMRTPEAFENLPMILEGDIPADARRSMSPTTEREREEEM